VDQGERDQVDEGRGHRRVNPLWTAHRDRAALTYRRTGVLLDRYYNIQRHLRETFLVTGNGGTVVGFLTVPVVLPGTSSRMLIPAAQAVARSAKSCMREWLPICADRDSDLTALEVTPYAAFAIAGV